MDENVQIILNTLSEAMAAATPQATQFALSSVVNELQKYLDSLDNFYVNLESNSRPIIDMYREMGATEATIAYAVSRQSDYSTQAEELLKTGYSLINQIRQFFTNEEIIYRVGIENNGRLYETNLKESELLRFIRAEDNQKMTNIDNLFKLRMYNKAGLTEYIKSHDNTVETAVNEGSTIYSRVRRYIHLNNNSNQKNVGQVYEVYASLVAERGGNNKSRIQADTIRKAFDRVKKNSATFIKGGDYLNMQMKFFGGSAPSIASTQRIRQDIQNFVNYLNDFLRNKNTASLTSNLKQLFIKDPKTQQCADAAEREASRQAIKYLNEVAKNLSIEVVT